MANFVYRVSFSTVGGKIDKLLIADHPDIRAATTSWLERKEILFVRSRNEADGCALFPMSNGVTNSCLIGKIRVNRERYCASRPSKSRACDSNAKGADPTAAKRLWSRCYYPKICNIP
jgi:hypothetical protein